MLPLAFTVPPVATAALEHIQHGDLRVIFTAKDVYRNHWAGLSRKEDVAAALSVIEDHGWVRGRKVETRGRPSYQYTVHPVLRRAADGHTSR